MINRFFILLCLLPLFFGCNREDLPYGVEASVMKAYSPGIYADDQGHELHYRFLKAKSTGEALPLVVFLHGRSESGADNLSQLRHGARYFRDVQTGWPCHVLFPQCPDTLYWTYPARPEPRIPELMSTPAEPTALYGQLLELIDYIADNNPVDRSRIHLVGFSMGGYGALDIAVRASGKFASVTCIAGGINLHRAFDLRNVPLWLEQTADDTEGTPEMMYSLADYLQDSETLHTGFYPTGGHNAFHLFRTWDYISWLYSQSLLTPRR